MKFVDKMKDWVAQNPDKAGSAIEKAGDFVDRRTKGKYADKIGKVQDAARQRVNPGVPPTTPQPPANPTTPPPTIQPPVNPPPQMP